MAFDPQKHHRRSIRLKGYDYAQAGAYYFTVVAQHRACLFGKIVRAEMILNDAGEMVWQQWNALAERFPNVELDEFVVMPNHMHGILLITDKPRTDNGASLSAVSHDRAEGRAQGTAPTSDSSHSGDRLSLPDGTRQGREEGRAQGTAPTPTVAHSSGLGDILRAFKSSVTTEYIKGVQLHKWEPFEGKLLQRNYWEHIIRNEGELDSIREYILNNPVTWENDGNNPKNGKPM